MLLSPSRALALRFFFADFHVFIIFSFRVRVSLSRSLSILHSTGCDGMGISVRAGMGWEG